MGGLFLGFLCAVVYLALLGRLRARELPGRLETWLCLGLVATTGLDGLNAFFFDGNLPHLYAPMIGPRLFTGLVAGYGVGLLALPILAQARHANGSGERSIEGPEEIAIGLAGVFLLGTVVLLAPAPLLWPLAALMVLAVLVAFGVGNLYLLGRFTGLSSGGKGHLVTAEGLAILEVVGLALLRQWMVVALGVRWAA